MVMDRNSHPALALGSLVVVVNTELRHMLHVELNVTGDRRTVRTVNRRKVVVVCITMSTKMLTIGHGKNQDVSIRHGEQDMSTKILACQSRYVRYFLSKQLYHSNIMRSHSPHTELFGSVQ